MDMNDVIISLGGIERILAPCDLTVTDEKLAEHLANNVIGQSYTVEQVRIQQPIYEDMVLHPKPVIPTTVSMRQARLALLEVEILDEVNTAIATATEADKITWEYATEVNRSDTLVTNMAIALNLTETDLDNLFILASTL